MQQFQTTIAYLLVCSLLTAQLLCGCAGDLSATDLTAPDVTAQVVPPCHGAEPESTEHDSGNAHDCRHCDASDAAAVLANPSDILPGSQRDIPDPVLVTLQAARPASDWHFDAGAGPPYPLISSTPETLVSQHILLLI